MNSSSRLYVPAIQGFVVFLWTLAVKSATMLVVYMASATKDSLFRDFPNWAIHLTVITAGLFIYNSVLRLVYMFDRGARMEYVEENASAPSIGKDFVGMIRSKTFWIQNAVAMPLFAVAALLGAYPDIGGIILGEGSIGTSLCNVLSTVILVPVLFVIGFFTRYEVHRYWVVLEKRQDTEKVEKISSFIWQALLITLAYPIVYPYSPLLLGAIVSVFNIIFTLFDALSIIGTLAAIVLIILIIYVFPLLNGIRKRRKFIKQLKNICKEAGYTLSDISHPYRSFIRPSIGANFTIAKDGTEYKCAFVSTLHRGTWLSFVSDTDAYFRHRIGTKNHHFTLNHHIEYGIRGKCRKFIIISPLPKKVFAESDGSMREILPGDRIWDYTVYNMTGFINAIDRNCLDKYNGSRE